MLLDRSNDSSSRASLLHDEIPTVPLDDVLDPPILVTGENEERLVGALDPAELHRRDADRSDARLVRALADDVDIGKLGAEALRHSDDLLVHGSKQELVARATGGSLGLLRHRVPLPI